MKLIRLERITGIQLVGYGDRYDPKAADMFAEALLAFIATQGQHLDHSRFSPIQTVLGTPFPLSDPDRGIFLLQGKPDVSR